MHTRSPIPPHIMQADHKKTQRDKFNQIPKQLAINHGQRPGEHGTGERRRTQESTQIRDGHRRGQKTPGEPSDPRAAQGSALITFMFTITVIILILIVVVSFVVKADSTSPYQVQPWPELFDSSVPGPVP